MNIESLSSLEYLHLRSESVERITLKSLNALKCLTLYISDIITNLQPDFYDQMPNIEVLTINCEFLDLNFRKLDQKLVIRNLCNRSFNIDQFFNHTHRNIEKLSVISCDDKQISKLFSVCDNFRNLSQLDINDCEITKIDKRMFYESNHLRSLSLNRNKTQIIDTDAFSNLKLLVSLDLSTNLIESIDKLTFSELVNLEKLSLNGNRLKNLHENIFSNLKSLRQLDLGSNELKFLNARLFFGLGNLYELNLSANGLIDFDLCILNYLRELKKINLSKNLIKQENETEIVHRFKENGIEEILILKFLQ